MRRGLTLHELRVMARHNRGLARSLRLDRFFPELRESPPPPSPLIELLEAVPARERVQYVGLKVGPELGYRGVRTFRSAEAAFKWLRPQRPDGYELSWRDRRFCRRLTRQDLAACCHRPPPPDLVQLWDRRLPIP